MSKNNQVSLNTDELKDYLTHIITNNRHLQSQGKNTVSTEVTGESGIGKTSAIVQLADEMGLNFVKLNLAQIEELGDLVGFPKKEYQMAINKGTEDKPQWFTKWIDEILIEDARNKGYQATGKDRMSYSPPEWISDKEGGILLLDDWNRADIRFIQAVMEIVDRGEYISWKLPKDWHIILTSNPDTGDYLVQSIDSAQRTRFITALLKFDVETWAKWAETEGIDGRCINFLLMHPELVTQDTNARSITTFFNAISSYKVFEDDLPMIQMIGEGSVGPEFSTMFTQFINNKLDKLVDPKTMLTHDSHEYVKKAVREAVGIDHNYRADIASVLCTRLANYALHFAEENAVTQKVIDRMIMLSTEDLFANDLKYYAVREVLSGNKKKFEKLMMNPEVVKMVTQ
ncbi:MAG: ATP-binding protein [Candidatus Kariarchaeaceae archaeon]|jgi:hypothetical protein